jgi:hypothetical protein
VPFTQRFKNFQLYSKAFVIFFIATLIHNQSAYSRPMEWQGIFGADATQINNYRRTSSPQILDGTGNLPAGSQQIPTANGNHEDASFQTYILKLQPSIIINDGATFFSEITSGYGSGSFFGDSTVTKKDANNTFGNALYMNNSTLSDVKFTQFYLKLYSDTATYTVGRQNVNWGLGALYNDGHKNWSRYTSINDGLTADFKAGNFYITPFWAMINSQSDVTKASHTSTYGIRLLYDSVEKDMAFGLIYGNRSSGSNNTFYVGANGNPLGKTDLKIIDFYLKKTYGKLQFQFEVPMISGEMSNVFGTQQKDTYKTFALFSENSYRFNDNWNFGVNFGYASGEDGNGPNFEAFYTHPNYKVANILFRYNMFATNNTTQSIFDAYLTNVQYMRIPVSFIAGSWTFEAAYIYAKAIESAQNGKSAFEHEKNQFFTASGTQGKNYGSEIDVNVLYQWNSNVSVSINLGYLFVGDYYKFTNSTQSLNLENSYLLQSGVIATF